jgi:hypothetical protein
VLISYAPESYEIKGISAWEQVESVPHITLLHSNLYDTAFVGPSRSLKALTNCVVVRVFAVARTTPARMPVNFVRFRLALPRASADLISHNSPPCWQCLGREWVAVQRRVQLRIDDRNEGIDGCAAQESPEEGNKVGSIHPRSFLCD